MQTVIGWITLIIFSIIFIVQFYVYYAARRVLNRIAQESSGREIAIEASDTVGKSARARLKWLRNNKLNLTVEIISDANRVLWADTLTYLLFGVLILLWLIASQFN